MSLTVASAGCSWQQTTSVENQLECMDGTLCIGWSCCSGHGGRARCPPNKPLMCSSKTCGDGDYCCKASCDEFGGQRICNPASCPWKQTTDVTGLLECVDGTTCSGWSCCAGHGGRAKCPPNLPLMCDSRTCGEGDYCCKTSCEDFGGERACETSDLPSPSPTCTWLRTTSVENQLQCGDGTTCTGWSCCTARGGRAKCPPNKPLMCNSRTCGDGDFCCKATCEAYGGLRKCQAAALPAILMLGNSYTFYHGGVDGALRAMFASTSSAWYVKALTKGGSNWNYHLAQIQAAGTPHHNALMSSLGGETSWGFVVVQEQSHVPALCCHTSPLYTDSSFAASARAVVELDKLAEARGATTVLYQTWGRRDGHATRSYISTFKSMNEAVSQGYQHYASLITRPDRVPVVAPVGRAFGLIYDRIVEAGQDPSASSSLFHRLYDPDATHPSALGTYLAACVVYASITGETAIGLPPVGISGEEAAVLQTTAMQAVSEQ